MSSYKVDYDELISGDLFVTVVFAGGAVNFMHITYLFSMTKAFSAARASFIYFEDNFIIPVRFFVRNLDIPRRVLK
jgi:hypothetical protein